jgi:hypothetical protein
LVSLALLSGCLTPSGYVPLRQSDGVGYQVEAIEDGRHRVRFCGNTANSLAEVKDYAHLRAAEFTIEQGYQKFAVLSVVTRMTEGGSSTSTYYSGGTTSSGMRIAEPGISASSPIQSANAPTLVPSRPADKVTVVSEFARMPECVLIIQIVTKEGMSFRPNVTVARAAPMIENIRKRHPAK